MCPSAWVATKPLWWVLGQHIVLMIAYILRSTCFCEIWALWVSWITYNQLYYALCLVCWELSSSLVPAMYNRISCAQVHEFPQNHCSENREGTLFLWLHIYYAHLAFVRFEHFGCRGSLMTTYIYIYKFKIS